MPNESQADAASFAPHDPAAANLYALIESTEDLIWSIDLNYSILTFNTALQRHIEHSFGTRIAVGKRPEDLLPPERAILWPPLFERALTHGPFRIEVPFPGDRTLEMSFNPIVVDGKPTGLSVFGKDVTERNRAERQLRETAESLNETQRIGAIGSYALDIPAGRWTSSDVLDGLFDIGKEYDRTVEGWTALIHPEDRAMMAEYFLSEVVGKRRKFNKEYRIVRARDRVERWLHGMGKLEFDAAGQPVKLRGVIRDITEQKRADLQLRESEQRYRATFEQAAVGILHTSLDGRLLGSNARFAEIIGYRLDEVPNLTFQQITPAEDIDESNGVLEQMLNGDLESASWEKRYLRKDGVPTWVRLTVSTRRDEKGRALNFITMVEDIDSRKAAEERLSKIQEELRHSENRYRTAFHTSIDAVNINRLSDGTYIECNKSFLDMTGFTREEVIGRSSLELGVWANPAVRQRMVEAVRGHSICRDLEAQFRARDGKLFWGLMSATLIEIEGVACVLTVTRDISAAKAAEERIADAAEALRVSEERYLTVFQTSLDAITISRVDTEEYVDVNQAFLDVTGFTREDVIGRTTRQLKIWKNLGDRDNLLERVRCGGECRNLEIQFRKKNGEFIWGMVSASIVEIDGISCVLAIARDISSAKAAEDEIRNLAFYDTLTGLPNRRLLLERLRQALASGNRADRKRALLFVDLDNFKTLNDTLGHQTGDLMLQEASRRLTTCVRDADTVSRLGGDEFVLMLEDLSEVPEEAAAQAKLVGEKILATVAQPYLLDGHECRSSASIGISVFGDRRESTSEVLQQADIAMYQAKTAGRNTMRFFAPALQAAVNARAAMEEDLRVAIQTGQFVLYFQPQIDRNRLSGAEALIRWKHPWRNVLSPNEFIHLAEQTGLILPLGKWVLEAACAQIAAWADRKPAARLTLAINISALQFHQPDFVEQVLSALDRAGANPSKLRLELTESMLVENVEEVIGKMTMLKAHGLRFSLDDFGTGYSSLAYLKRLPLDQLKIDRSFIRDILTDESSAAIAQTIISLSRAMGLPVIAEGVETEEQREFLTRLGCHAFQGYLYSRPLPLEEFQRQWMPAAEDTVSAAS